MFYIVITSLQAKHICSNLLLSAYCYCDRPASVLSRAQFVLRCFRTIVANLSAKAKPPPSIRLRKNVLNVVVTCEIKQKTFASHHWNVLHSGCTRWALLGDCVKVIVVVLSVHVCRTSELLWRRREPRTSGCESASREDCRVCQ